MMVMNVFCGYDGRSIRDSEKRGMDRQMEQRQKSKDPRKEPNQVSMEKEEFTNRTEKEGYI